MKVLNIGSLNIDYVFSVDSLVKRGETKRAESMKVICGGKGLNQSIALRRAGMEVMHAGVIGMDGLMLKEILEGTGVDTTCVQEGPEKSGHAFIQVNQSGDNSIILYPGANETLTMDLVRSWLDKCDPQEDVVLLQNETNLTAEIIEEAYGRGFRIAFNAAPADLSTISYPLEHVTWLFVNELEGMMLTGERIPMLMIKSLRQRCPGVELIITQGDQGSMIHSNGLNHMIKALPAEAVDTTGAGDTYVGYYLMSRMCGEDALEAGKTATAAAIIAVTRSGAASSIPSMQEVKEFMSGQ